MHFTNFRLFLSLKIVNYCIYDINLHFLYALILSSLMLLLVNGDTFSYGNIASYWLLANFLESIDELDLRNESSSIILR